MPAYQHKQQIQHHQSYICFSGILNKVIPTKYKMLRTVTTITIANPIPVPGAEKKPLQLDIENVRAMYANAITGAERYP